MGSRSRRRGRWTQSDRHRADFSHLLPSPPKERRGPRWWQRIVDWLFRPVGEPPDPDQLVELTSVPSRQDAHNLVQELHLHGIPAHLFGGDADGAAPHFAMAHGHRVMVQAKDHERAVHALRGGVR